MELTKSSFLIHTQHKSLESSFLLANSQILKNKVVLRLNLTLEVSGKLFCQCASLTYFCTDRFGKT